MDSSLKDWTHMNVMHKNFDDKIAFKRSYCRLKFNRSVLKK